MFKEILQFVDPDVLAKHLPGLGGDPLKLLMRWEQQAIEQGWDVDYYILSKIKYHTHRSTTHENLRNLIARFTTRAS